MTVPETPGAADLAQRLAFQPEAVLCPGAHIGPVEEPLEEVRVGIFEGGQLVGSVRGFVSEGVGHIERGGPLIMLRKQAEVKA